MLHLDNLAYVNFVHIFPYSIIQMEAHNYPQIWG